MTKRETDTLEAHFEQARATPPQMPAGMMDRLIADAVSSPRSRDNAQTTGSKDGMPAITHS